jgi:acetyltransferase EpsM
MPKPIIIIGYGGHAAEAAAAALAMSIIDESTIEGFVDSDPSGKPPELFGLPLLGDESILTGREKEIKLHIAIGDNALRRKIADRFKGFEFATIIHASSSVGPWVEIGDGSLLAPGCVCTARLSIGSHVIINTGSIISHDCEIGDYANISPGCILAGNVKIGENTFLGSGVSIAPGVSIGADSKISIGSVVTKDIPSGVTAAGTPARVIDKG